MKWGVCVPAGGGGWGTRDRGQGEGYWPEVRVDALADLPRVLLSLLSSRIPSAQGLRGGAGRRGLLTGRPWPPHPELAGRVEGVQGGWESSGIWGRLTQTVKQ